MEAGVDAALRFCRRQHIDLAGLDFLFNAHQGHPEPLFLEVNWVFGRRGLGGSEGFYRLLIPEIHRWLARRRLAVRHPD
jgi:ribosomal protein S6--L-glutamate ligase